MEMDILQTTREAGLENMVIFSKIFSIYIYQAFAHTLLKLYEIYYQIIVCVCVCVCIAY